MSWWTITEERKSTFANWFYKHSKTKGARQLLFWNAFLESSFLPIPPDPLLAALVLGENGSWKRLAFVTTIASTIGGLVGYAIGYLFFETLGVRIVEFYNIAESFREVNVLYNEYAFWAVFIAGFTLIPYKVFTIAAGVFAINIPMFVVASVLGRGLRFYLVAYLVSVYGKRAAETLYKRINVFFFGVLFLIAILLFILLG